MILYSQIFIQSVSYWQIPMLTLLCITMNKDFSEKVAEIYETSWFTIHKIMTGWFFINEIDCLHNPYQSIR